MPKIIPWYRIHAIMDIDTPLISVIIPTCNRPSLLEAAIRSVLWQTYPAFEIVVVDDASTTDTCQVVESFGDDRITWVRNEYNQGAAVSRNRGADRAKGELLAFLDDDDEWVPHKLAEQVKLFDGPEVGMVLCYAHDKRFGLRKIWKPAPEVTYEDLFKSNSISPTSTFLVRKSFFQQVDGFDPALRSGTEYDLAFRLSKRSAIRTAPMLMVTMKAAKDGHQSTKWPEKLSSWMTLHRKYRSTYGEFGFKGLVLKYCKHLVIICLYLAGCVIGGRIYRVIRYLKTVQDRVVWR